MNRVPAMWGLVFAVVTIAVHVLLGREASVLVASVVMAMIGAIYVGFALSDGRPRTIVIEVIVAFMFGGAALCGALVSPWFIVAALIGHGCWDALHHRPSVLTKIPKWYIPYCAVYDIVAGVGLAVLWFMRGVISR